MSIMIGSGNATLTGLRFESLQLTNFLSYRSARLVLSDLSALVGPNASGKSNAVAAIKLLREIPFHGLPTAVARRGGFDQLRHRSAGHPYNPGLRLSFSFEGARPSYYDLQFRALQGKRYEVKRESARVYLGGEALEFSQADGVVQFSETSDGGRRFDSEDLDRTLRVPPGQSVVSAGMGGLASHLVAEVLQAMQTVEINPARVGELQEPSSTREFEPDGSNTASIFDTLGTAERSQLRDELSAIVPGIEDIEIRRLADRVTVAFLQDTDRGRREFLAKQMSDGTLRAFGVLLAMHQEPKPRLLVIEEPEIAIHLGALRTLVEILQQQSEDSQVLITTHSADIIDLLEVSDLRVVWTQSGSSRVAHVADHTMSTVRDGLITPGQLLRSDALDPAV